MKAISSRRRKQGGFSLVELMLVIGIGVLITIVAISLYGAAAERQKVSRVVNEYSSLVASINGLYANSPNYTGLTDAVVINGADLPKGMYDPAGPTLLYPWGTMTVAPAGAGNHQFTVTYNDGMPEKSCVTFVTTLLNSVEQITVGGTPVTNQSDAVSACAGGGAAIVVTNR